MSQPRRSVYGIFTYIGVVLGVNVGIYGIHGVSGFQSDHVPMSVPVDFG